MTDRDTFAAAALTGLLADGQWPEDSAAAAAEEAYLHADAMLRERANNTPVAESATTAGPVAWAVVYPNDEVAVIAFKRSDADERATASDRIVPLYRQPQPMLTNAEREAVERGYCSLMGVQDMSAECSRWDAEAAATLRGLLDRLG